MKPDSILCPDTDIAASNAIFSRKIGIPLDRTIIHMMEGSFTGSREWFKDYTRPAKHIIPTAAHYLVSTTGRLLQMVPEDMKCYHASNYNSRSIGIELEGFTAKTSYPVAMLVAAADLVRDIHMRHNIPIDRAHIIGHYEVPGATHTDPGTHFPWDIFMAMILGKDGAPHV